MFRWITLGLIGLAIVVFGFSLVDVGGSGDIGANATFSSPDIDYDAFARANGPGYEWQFPQDHGPHPDFLTEWWYYTGNVKADDGRHFGYQFTIFRRAIVPEEPGIDSEWRTRQIYLAHIGISDIEGEQFFHGERFSRGAAGLAGAQIEPNFRVWLEDWQVVSDEGDMADIQMIADIGGAALDLNLIQAKPIVFQGDQGYSFKGGDDPGNASYYYTIPRFTTEGTITIGDETFTVSGESWMDHEFSTSALPEQATGWDWFGLIFDDGRELMLYQIREADGGVEPASKGRLINADGSSILLSIENYQMTPLDTWTSDYTGATYPAGWEITIDADAIGADEPLTFRTIPLMLDQELHTDPSYWEGAVRIEGDVTGYGYNEMTGYATNMNGRF